MSEGDTDTDRGTVISDLLAVVGLVSATTVLAYWSFELLNPLRTLLGLFSVLLAPGYVTLAAVLPRPSGTTEADPSEWITLSNTHRGSLPRWTAAGLSRLERTVLSVLVSVVVVPVLGVLLSLAAIRITPTTIIFTVTGYTLSVGVVAALRRWVHNEGTSDPTPEGGDPLFTGLKPPGNRVDALLNLSLLLLIVVGGTVVVAPSLGQDTAAFTEFYVLAGTGGDEPAMDEYLSTTEPGETTRILADITNREHRPLNYTVVVQVQRTELTNRSVTVLDRRRASRFSVELSHNESARIPYRFTASGAETGCRVVFLLYTDGVPASPTIENAHRELHLWHTTDPPNGGGDCRSLDAVDVRVDRTGVTVSTPAPSVDEPRGHGSSKE